MTGHPGLTAHLAGWRRLEDVEPEDAAESHRTDFHLGMVLEGEAAREFDEYMANPTCTEKGEALIRESVRRVKEQEATCAACQHLDCCRKWGLY